MPRHPRLTDRAAGQLERPAGATVEKRLDHPLVLLGVDTAGRINDPSTRRHEPRRGVQQRELLAAVLVEVPRLEPPFHIGAVPHHARVRARHVNDHRVVTVRQLVLEQGRRGISQQVGLHECDFHAVGAGQVFLQPRNARTRQIHRDDLARLHRIGHQQALAPGRRTAIEDRLARLRRQQLHRQARTRILQVDFSALQQRFDFRPVPGRHLVEAGPLRRLQEVRGGLALRPSPSGIYRRRPLVPLEQLAGRVCTEVHQPALHEPVRMRKILRQHVRRRDFRRRRHGQCQGQLAHNRIDQAGLGLARDGLGLLDGMVHDLGHQPVALGRIRRLDQLITGHEQHRPGRKPGRVRHQPAQRGLQPAEVADHAKHEVLASRPLGSAEAGRQRVDELIDALAAVEPLGQQADGGRPGG